ncbi:MAG: hypothetical protein ABF553_01580 [Acetobacter orientalis]|uniref:hypothetical protein n=1 Tax=Acetobacter orientalis TaxID=146474 RepID=UPI0039E73452
MSDAKRNLSGLWHGQFSYPRTFQPEFFTATLLDQAGSLSGSITDKVTDPTHATGVFLAHVRGQHVGADVHFSKQYESAARPHRVRYTGQVNADGTEISGTWQIDGSWSGPFLMVRAQPSQEVSVQRYETLEV